MNRVGCGGRSGIERRMFIRYHLCMFFRGYKLFMLEIREATNDFQNCLCDFKDREAISEVWCGVLNMCLCDMCFSVKYCRGQIIAGQIFVGSEI